MKTYKNIVVGAYVSHNCLYDFKDLYDYLT